jgi:hypothetical protein
MLEPNSRCIYLEELRPPLGYRLDRAIATTFSLDLLTLLMAPLSMALNECRNREDALKDPIAVLEALRQTRDRLTVFCQQGRIAIPRKDAILYRYLEPVVVEAQPHGGNGVFHPKTWFLRFVPEDPAEAIFYRFMCLSKNLTFDRSWDTALCLEGYLQNRQKAHARNRPLSEFLAHLPTLAVRGVSERQRQDVALVSDEILRVKFEPPDDFDDDITFMPIGIPGHDGAPNPDNARKVLIVSPFLSAEAALWLTESGRDNILVSRPEALDGLDDSTLLELEQNTRIFTLDDAAERPQEDREADADAADSETPLPANDFSGLHAKLYIIENGWDATVYSGSANATLAAFEGNNVESLVGMTGRKSRVGIDAFLGNDNSPLSFRGMLRPYTREGSVEVDSIQGLLEKALEASRQAIGKAGYSVVVTPGEDGTYDLVVTSEEPLELPAEVVARCFPISLALADSRVMATDQPLRFDGLSLASLTGFIAFVVTAVHEGRTASVGFVLNLPTTGIPASRDHKVLQEIISDPARFIRYLLLILAEEEQLTGAEFDPTAPTGHGSWRSQAGTPLLEEMVRAFSRHPEKIARIQQLVEDMKASPEGVALLPPGFDELWDAFQAASIQGDAI